MNLKCSGKEITLGSLFDGISGFPYAGSLFGIKTLWASEILPQAISVSKRHFPHMEHLGDITQLDGKRIAPVDIITFGSPCQDLSVARGTRLGLDGKRSGLFMEAIRIIKEMREGTNGEYPKFALWENVPGAFSSNKGNDFRILLEAFTETKIPMPIGGKWANAGMVRGHCVDFAWRTLDAQYWNVPQRRRRIFAVASFNGQCAAEILFKLESLYRYLTPSGAPWEGVAAYAQRSVNCPIAVLNDQGGASLTVEKSPISPTLRTETHGNLPVIGVNQNAYGNISTSDVAYTLLTAPNASGRNAPLIAVHPDICGTLCGSGAGLPRPAGMCSECDLCVVCPALTKINVVAYCLQGNMIGRKDNNGPQGNGINENVCFSLNCIDRHSVAAIDCRNHKEYDQLSGTLQAKQGGSYSLNYQNPIRCGYIVRRLTPTECERLMGFPDDWTAFGSDGKPISDTPRYQMLGNSVVTNCVAYVLAGIVEQLRKENT